MFCKNCGAPLGEKDSFCQKCGAKTGGTPKKKKTGAVKWILIAAGILLAVFAAAVLFREEDAGSSTSTAEPAGSAGNQAYTELSGYADLTEEELLEELGFKKTESSCYPNDDNINFMCNWGKVYLIRLDASHSKDSGYSLFGIRLGDDAEDARDILSSEFELTATRKTDTEQSDVYVENSTGYGLVIDYNSDFWIIRISYIMESSGESGTGGTEPPEEAGEAESPAFEIIPGYTYESDQSDEEIGDFRLYMNLTYNEDGSISVYGWGFENYELSENCLVDEVVYPVSSDEYVNEYESENGDFSLFQSLEYDSYTAMSDYNYFTGDFYPVSE